MSHRVSGAWAVTAACLLPLLPLLPMLAVGCGSSSAPASSTAAVVHPDVPLMVDGLYVNQNPEQGPYSQVSFIGYLGRYIAERSPCADPSDGSCHEQGAFSGDGNGSIVLTDDATQRTTTLPYDVADVMATPTRLPPPDQITVDGGAAVQSETGDIVITIGSGPTDGGASGSGLTISVDAGPLVVDGVNIGAVVQLITKLLFGGSTFTLTNDTNGLPVSSTNPPVQAPIGVVTLVNSVPVSTSTGTTGATGTTTSGVGTGSTTAGSTTTPSGAGTTATTPTPAPPASGTLLSGPAGNGKINPNHLMDDADMIGGTAISAAMVQKLLVSQNSALATLSQGGMTAAQIIVSQSTTNGVSPLYMIARIEGESGLIESSSSRNLPSATGCGCPDGSRCDPTVAGFSVQVACAAKLMANYTKELSSGGSTVSGWKVGKAKASLDPCTVTPDNASTAATYTYTPWVGAYSTGCGALAQGGSTLLGTLVARYKSALQ